MTYYRRPYYGGGSRGRGGFNKIGLIIALLFAGFALFKYFSQSQYNEITGENQRVSLSIEEEIQLGLQSTRQMISQHGGLHPDTKHQDIVKAVGKRLIDNSIARSTAYEYDFHLLADPNSINAFALPGGQCFITYALYSKLQNEDQLAGVMGHEIGHVIARHGAERIAKQELTAGLTGAAVIAAGDYGSAQAAQMIASMVNMKYGRQQELESDDLGIRFMIEAGYDPTQMKGVMKILKEASSGNRQPEFLSTHPDPGNRMEEIDRSIEKYSGKLLAPPKHPNDMD